MTFEGWLIRGGFWVGVVLGAGGGVVWTGCRMCVWYEYEQNTGGSL